MDHLNLPIWFCSFMDYFRWGPSDQFVDHCVPSPKMYTEPNAYPYRPMNNYFFCINFWHFVLEVRIFIPGTC